MKKVLLFTILATTMLIATSLQSAEVIPIWNRSIEEGSIQDIELLKDGKEFLMISGTWDKGQIQVRSTTDGELIRSMPVNLDHNGRIALTPDSTRLILLNGLNCELRNLDDSFSIVKSFNFDVLFKQISIDPIRPYVYLKGNKLQAYNYETGELVKEFSGYITDINSGIAVSDDGKYLATLNDGKAYLKVWELEKMELIRDVQLWDEKLPDFDWRCEGKDIQFSKLNSDVIYYSGYFPSEKLDVKINSGLRKFTISLFDNSDNIQERNFSGKFIIFDKENRCLTYSNGTMSFYNFKEKQQEFYNIPPNNIYVGGKTIYNRRYNSFIGFKGTNISKFQYDSETEIEAINEYVITISPNPTNSFVNINLNCSKLKIDYHINDINGILLKQNTIATQSNNLRIDFTSYPSGVYFVTINCNTSKTYKVIKQN